MDLASKVDIDRSVKSIDGPEMDMVDIAGAEET